VTGAGAHSKTFFLFYCDLAKTARHVLELCYKAIFNVFIR